MKKQKTTKHIFTYAVAACLLIFLGFGTYTYASPYTYVSMDVNPSIEYSLNRFNLVLSVIGINDDGTELLNGIELTSLKNKNIEEALALTIEQISEAGYFALEDGGLIITTSSNNMENDIALAANLENIAKESIKKSNKQVLVMSEVVDNEYLEKALSEGVSPGKMLLVERLTETVGSLENIDKEEWLQKSVREIMKETNQYREEIKEAEKEQEKNQIKEKTQEQIEPDEDEDEKQYQEQHEEKEINSSDEPQAQENNSFKKIDEDSETSSNQYNNPNNNSSENGNSRNNDFDNDDSNYDNDYDDDDYDDDDYDNDDDDNSNNNTSNN